MTRPLAEIQADRLRAALAEACCDDCAQPKKAKTCCSAKKAPEKVLPVDQTGQDVEVRAEAKESTTHPFIKRCVAAMTKDSDPDSADVSKAFAVCTAQMKRSPKAAKAKKKEGVPEGRMADYERALSKARKDRARMHGNGGND